MPKIQYKDIAFRKATLDVIKAANVIIAEYAAQGFDLTLRQLYYQFVSRDMLANTQKSYDKLGSIINDARLAGLVDWNAITDRTRNIREVSHWASPDEILSVCSKSFRIDKWEEQDKRIEVWIEKDALVGVFEGVCRENDVGLFSCRGYVSQSEMWAAAQRMRAYERKNQETLILHFGDHDPSGIDMSRDIQERLWMFGAQTRLIRMALTMTQVEEYEPPPNPAKISDSRFESYAARFGDESWELDALEPTTLAALVNDEIEKHRDEEIWERALDKEVDHRTALKKLSVNYDNVRTFIAPFFDVELDGSDD